MKIIKIIVTALLLICFASCKNKETEVKQVENTNKNIVFAIPFAPVSYPIIKMVADGWNYYIRQDIRLRDLELYKLTLNYEKKKQKLQSII